MSTRIVERVDDWETVPFSGGYAGLQTLSDDGFSGVVIAGPARLFMLNGTVVGILDGSIEDFESAEGTAREAPHESLPLLAVMQERSDEVRAKYYTEDTSISEVDGTLESGGFTGYVELSENVLSGDYYLVYHQGRSMSVAYVGQSEQLLTDDEAFERTDDEVGIYEVRPVDIDLVEIPEPEDDEGTTDDGPLAASDAGDADPSPAATVTSDSSSTSGTDDPSADEAAGTTAEETSTAVEAGTDETQATDDAGPTTDDAAADAGTGDTGGAADSGAATDSGTAAGDTTTDDAPTADDDAGAADTRSEETADARSTDAADTRSPDAHSTDAADTRSADTTDTRSADTGTAEPTAETGEDTQSGATSAQRDTASDERSGVAPASGAGRGRSRSSQREPSEDRPASPGSERQDGSAASPGSLETRSIPSLDPGRTEAASKPAPDTGRSRSPRSGGDQRRQQRSQQAGGQSRPSRSQSASPTEERPGEGARQTEPEPSEQRPQESRQPDSAAESNELQEKLDEQRETVERLENELDSVQSERDQLREERDDLREEREQLREERDRLQSELDEARTEIERLEQRIEEIGADAGASGATSLTVQEAIDGTNLFVRYDSKGDPTLESAHGGSVDRETVAENVRLEYHTQFDAGDAVVAGEAFDDFLTGTIQYRFVDWLIGELLYEIRDTASDDEMRDLYDALPKIDRAELNGEVSVTYVEDGEEHRTQERFDVVVRDRMGNPLVVANLNDSRQPVTDSMMTELVTSAERLGKSSDSLAGAFLVTSSFFEPEALETAKGATSSGLLSRNKRKSFVNLSRKDGYHLCLVEARNREFHLAVPEL